LKQQAVPADIRDYTTFADELTVADDFVFKGNRVVVPHGARDDILTIKQKTINDSKVQA